MVQSSNSSPGATFLVSADRQLLDRRDNHHKDYHREINIHEVNNDNRNLIANSSQHNLIDNQPQIGEDKGGEDEEVEEIVSTSLTAPFLGDTQNTNVISAKSDNDDSNNNTRNPGSTSASNTTSKSSSFAINNLIEQFDGGSILSKSASILTFFYSFARSSGHSGKEGEQRNNYDDDTILDNISGSYYSALPDTFSLSDFETRKMSGSHNGAKDEHQRSSVTEEHLYLWQTCDTTKKSRKFETNKERVMAQSDFQVFWNDITYEIKPKLNFNYIREKFKSTCNVSDTWQRYVQHKDFVVGKDLESESQPTRAFLGTESVTILNHVDGSFKSGQLTALMGPSGAGKTSLLNFLARRKEKDYSGWLTLTGRSKKIKISMIPQHDSLPGNLTVRENLTYACRLKNAHKAEIDHKKNIETIANLLGIGECLETKTKKISGGEQKRLSIAQELVSKPDILILDEPTSGLDSLTCYKTLSILRDLVRASSSKLIDPIAIVLSIHQPQQEVFELFDKIYIISTGGIPIYNGSPTECVQYVEQCVGITMPSSDYNPASFMIELASGEYGREPIIKLENLLKINFQRDVNCLPELCDNSSRLGDHSIRWTNHLNRMRNDEKLVILKSLLNDNNNQLVQSTSIDQTNRNDKYNDNITLSSSAASSSNKQVQHNRTLNIDPKIPKASSTNTGKSWHKTGILLERCWVSELRDPKQSIVKFLYFLVTPIALSLMMGKDSGAADGCPRYITSFELKDLMRNDSELLDKKVQEDLLLSLENLGLYFMTIFSIVTAIVGTMAVTFSTDIRRSMKEFHNGWYSMSCYLVARIVSEIPVHIILPTMTIALTFILTGQAAAHGLSNEYRFFLIDAGVVLSSFVAQILGMIIGAIFIGDITTALFVSQGILLPLVFVSGFVARTKNLSRFIYILSFTSFMKHCLDIAVIGRYGFGTCLCNNSIITGQPTQLLGVPERLKSFTDLWMSTSETMDSSSSKTDGPPINNNNINISGNFSNQVNLANDTGIDYYNITTIESQQTAASMAIQTTTAATELMTTERQPEKDIFQLFARQVFLYNTRGVDIKSCNDMTPYQMNEVSLSDDDMYFAFSALIIYIIIVILLLFVTVNFVMRYKKSF